MSLDKMALVTACLVTILDRNYRYAKAFNILRIIVDIQLIELTENRHIPKLHIGYTGEEKRLHWSLLVKKSGWLFYNCDV